MYLMSEEHHSLKFVLRHSFCKLSVRRFFIAVQVLKRFYPFEYPPFKNQLSGIRDPIGPSFGIHLGD